MTYSIKPYRLTICDYTKVKLEEVAAELGVSQEDVISSWLEEMAVLHREK